MLTANTLINETDSANERKRGGGRDIKKQIN